MMPTVFGIVVAFLLQFAVVAMPCFANIITFDDVDTQSSIVTLDNGYHGLNWDNFAVVDGTRFLPSGYIAGLVSSPNDAFNVYGAPASFSSASSFTFVSGYFSGAWKDGLNIAIQGFRGADLGYSTTVVVSSTAPTLRAFDWSGLTEVRFAPFGGTPNPSYSGNGTQFVMDNLAIEAVPEPGTSILVVGGLSGLLVLCRKRLWCGVVVIGSRHCDARS